MLISKGRLKTFSEETEKAEDFLNKALPPLDSKRTNYEDEDNDSTFKAEADRPPLPS